jgi:hypothetical protein
VEEVLPYKREVVKEFNIDYFRVQACAGAPAPPMWNGRSARVVTVDSETGWIRVVSRGWKADGGWWSYLRTVVLR